MFNATAVSLKPNGLNFGKESRDRETLGFSGLFALCLAVTTSLRMLKVLRKSARSLCAKDPWRPTSIVAI